MLETSMTSPTSGIRCDHDQVYGNPHPYTIKRGNVLYAMLFSMTFNLVILSGLWCGNQDSCTFDWGGLFIQTTARKLLFDGVSDPSFLKYYNMKLKSKGISFYCTTNSFDECGNDNYVCGDTGITINLPNDKTFTMALNVTRRDKFYAPYLEISKTGEMIWEHSIDQAEVLRAQVVKSDPSIWVERIVNPYFALYPSWTADTEINKFFQCQKRIFGGKPGRFNSCLQTVVTGRKNIIEKDELKLFMGNTSIFYLPDSSLNISNVKLSGKATMHQPTYGWNGISSYAYTYGGLTAGSDVFQLQTPTIFSDELPLSYVLTQDSLDVFDRSLPTPIPLSQGPDPVVSEKSDSILLRRFTENKKNWLILQDLGRPKDSYGMPYKMPVAMVSLERFADFPIFIGTSNNYGNRAWGGLEHLDVVGSQPDVLSQRTYIDYDPVTGRVLRKAIRPQINLRVERGPLLVNLVGSQDRCVVPTRQYLAGNGFGCYSYIPLIWYENARVVDPEEHFKLVTHFYGRPARVQMITTIGIAIGIVFIVLGMMVYLNDLYHRNRFLKRVYVD